MPAFLYHLFLFSGGGRLRLEDDTTGVGPPLHENQTMTQAGITSGQTVIVEPGQAPLSSQVYAILTAAHINMASTTRISIQNTISCVCIMTIESCLWI